MKRLLFALFFCLPFVQASAQYGQPEPLTRYDTVHMVMRTPKAVLQKLLSSQDKDSQKTGRLIESIEKRLEVSRAGFLANRIPTMNPTWFANSMKQLESLAIDTKYYVQEYFYYYPRPNQPYIRPTP